MVSFPVLIILCFVAAFGTVGNVFIIAAVCLQRRLRVRANAFVINLAVADLIITAYVMPSGLVTSRIGRNPFEKSACDFNAFMLMCSCGVSTQSLMAIALERYVHICRSVRYDRIFAKKLITAYLAFTWIYSIAWTIQGWSGWTRFIFGENTQLCIFDGPWSLSFDICLTIVGLLLPMGVVCFCYISIFRKLWKSRVALAGYTRSPLSAAPTRVSVAKSQSTDIPISRDDLISGRYDAIGGNDAICRSNVNGGNDVIAGRDVNHENDVTGGSEISGGNDVISGSDISRNDVIVGKYVSGASEVSGAVRGLTGHFQSHRRACRELRAVITLVVIVVLFVAFWIPAAVVLPLSAILTDDMPGACYTFSLWLALSNSSVNSVVYGAMNRHFRRGYKLFFSKVFCLKLCLRGRGAANRIPHNNGDAFSSDPVRRCQDTAVFNGTHSAPSAGTEENIHHLSACELRSKTKSEAYNLSSNFIINDPLRTEDKVREGSPSCIQFLHVYDEETKTPCSGPVIAVTVVKPTEQMCTATVGVFTDDSEV